ncbi:MAG: hypothetical protein WA364_26355 [Candidatus Nitrosopolaris sp.]
MNSKISLFLSSVAIAAKKLYGYSIEGRTVAHAKNIMDIMSVHEHYLVPTTMNEMNTFCCNTCGTTYCQLCGKSLIPRAAQIHKIVCMTK